ncbi:lysylphosphatidylglycerol synthase transmembrane domain-containing protein [Pseudonocardia sp. GCM10023141]|uniref:lysylphosphatidylglycerol synthase transmembrane domain-containing protein n=1 Tax=Pseudonocardia sp. GCM10023141 TaxID=3252653 RepID=UPI003605E61D
MTTSGTVPAGSDPGARPTGDEPDVPGPPSRSPGRRWVRRGVGLVVLLIVIEYGIVPLLADVDSVREAVRGVQAWWFVPGVALEALSILAYGLYTRALLGRAGRPPLSRVVRIDLTTWGAGHVLPGGPAGTAALRYRLLTDAGVGRSDAVLLAGVQGVVSAMILHVILWAALLIAIPLHGGIRLVELAVVIGLVAAADVLLVTVVAPRGLGRVGPALRRVAARIHATWVRQLERQSRDVVEQVRRIGRDRRRLALATTWAGLNWLLDAAALEVFLLALGQPVDPVGVLVGFGLASTLGVLPITPGGIGVVEGVLVPALVAFGVPAAPALVAVLGWRVVSFWLPVPAGLLSYLSLRLDIPAPDRHARR